MIGRDYYSWGSKRHISHRYGDNQGNPYKGPIKFSYLDDSRILIHSKPNILYVQNLVGAIETQIHPLVRRGSVGASTAEPPGLLRRNSSLSTLTTANLNGGSSVILDFDLDKEEDDEEMEDWEMKILMQETNELKQDRFPIHHAQMPAAIVASTTVYSKNLAVIADEQSRIKLYDLSTFEVKHSFGEIGTEPHQLLRPVTLATAQLDPHTFFILVGDSAEGQQQRISCFTSRGEFVVSAGSEGPMVGQFRDITCIAIKPFTCSKAHALFQDVDKRQHQQTVYQFWKMATSPKVNTTSASSIRARHNSSGSSTISANIAANGKSISSGGVFSYVEYPADDVYHCPYLPTWFQPMLSMEALEDALMQQQTNDDDLDNMDDMMGSNDRNGHRGDKAMNNFVVGLRSDFDANVYEILYISSEKNIMRLQVKYQSQADIDYLIAQGNVTLTEAEKVPGFYINNRMGEKIIYPSLHDLLRRNPYIQDVRIREESRDCLYFGVVDRRNYRVQICRLHWTKSLLFTPALDVVEVLGGHKQLHCELLDPIAMAYAPTGDIALCDLGRHAIIILSPQYQLVKVLKLAFESPRDLKEAGALAQRRRIQEQQQAEAEQKQLLLRKQRLQQSTTSAFMRDDASLLAEKQGSTYNTTKLSFAPGKSLSSPPKPPPSSSSDTHSTYSVSSSYVPGSSLTTGGRSAGLRSSLQSLGNGTANGTVGTGGVSNPLGIPSAKRPSWVSFGVDGSFVVGFYSGGLYVFKPNVALPVGTLEKLEFTVLAKIIVDYLTYDDVVVLRETCRFLHDFTRELRYSYQIFPPTRRLLLNRVLFLFTRWARLNADGADNLQDHVFYDAFHRPICRHYLQHMQCPFIKPAPKKKAAAKGGRQQRGRVGGDKGRKKSVVIADMVSAAAEAVAATSKRPSSSSPSRKPTMIVPTSSTISLHSQQPIGTTAASTAANTAHNKTALSSPGTRTTMANSTLSNLAADLPNAHQDTEKDVLSTEAYCTMSHAAVVYDRAELQLTGAYLLYDDFLFLVSDLFGPKFLYTFEAYLPELFRAYSHSEKVLYARHDGMSRANETKREKVPLSNVPVLYYNDVLELLLVLEEQHHGFKDLADHKLFRGRKSRGTDGHPTYRNLPNVATDFASLENKTAYTDVLAQYDDRGIDVSPVKQKLGRRMISRPGYEDAERELQQPITVKEHVALVHHTTERAVTLMNRLFS